MEMTRQWASASKAGAALLIALAMVCSVFVVTGDPAFAKAAKPGKIKVSTVQRTKATVNSMTVSFGKSKNATKYQVRYKKADAKKWKSVKTTKWSATLRSLKKYTKYNVQVRGINGKKKGAWTRARTFTTLGDYHTLTYDPGEGKLPDNQTTRQLRAGEELGEPPMPVLIGGVDAWFARWFTEPCGEGKEVHSSTLMGDADRTIYAIYSYDSNGQIDTLFSIYSEDLQNSPYSYMGEDVVKGLRETNKQDNVKSALVIIAGAHDCTLGNEYFRDDLTLKFRKSWNNKKVTELKGENNTFNGLKGFSAENVRFNFQRLGLFGTKEIDMKNVTIDGDLYIGHLTDESQDLEKLVEKIELKNVTVKGAVWIAGYPGHEIEVDLTGCRFENGVYLSNVKGETIDKLTVLQQSCQLNNARFRKMQNSTISAYGTGSGSALKMDGSEIWEINDCDIRSSAADGIEINPNDKLKSEEYVIKEINDSFISGENGLHMKGQDFSINRIKDTTILAAGGAALNLEKGGKGQPLLEYVCGKSVLCSSSGPVLSMKDGGKLICLDDDMNDVEPPKAIGTVRLWGGDGLYAKDTLGTFEFADEEGYALENSDPNFNRVENSKKVTECGHNFEGKEFYYVVYRGQ